MRRRSQAAVARIEIAGMFPALGVPVIRWPLLAGATHQHGEGYAEHTTNNLRGRHPAGRAHVREDGGGAGARTGHGPSGQTGGASEADANRHDEHAIGSGTK